MRTKAGFTLVEILAGGVISTVLAGAMLSLFYLVTGNIKDSAANSRLLRTQTVAEDQLRRAARKAYGVKLSQAEVSKGHGGLGDIATIAADDPVAYTALTEIWLYQADPDGLIGAYKVSAGSSQDTLKEWVNGAFTPMRIGSDTVLLTRAGSSFSVFPNRRGIAFDMRYRIQENGNSYAAPVLVDSVLCRAQL